MRTCTTGSVRLYSTLVAKLQEKRPLHDNIKMNFDLVGQLYTILILLPYQRVSAVFSTRS